MSDYRVGNIDSGNYNLVPGAASGAGTPGQQPAALEPQSRPVQAAENSQPLANQQKSAQQQEHKPAESDAEKSALPLTNMSNVVLKFKVNEDTRDITLYVIDRETKKVLRSIPPEEMNKLQAGDILELIA